MTREEYKELLSIRDREFLENLLYECKFERTCESCKYAYRNSQVHPDEQQGAILTARRNDCWSYCTHPDVYINIKKDFVCAGWEKKDDSI